MVLITPSIIEYFFKYTQQTPNLELEERLSYAKQEPEDEILEHINQSDKEDEASQKKDSRNAIRLKTLQDDCKKYNVGFYAAKKGELKATRVA